MSVSNIDICLVCSKIIKTCHKDIKCKICNLYVHKKCTNLNPKELKRHKDWICDKCNSAISNGNDTLIQNECESLINDVNISDVDLEEKFQNLCFNPLRYENIAKNNISEDFQYNECSYLTPEQFRTNISLTNTNSFSCLNLNIRSISKNFDKLKECLESLNHDFTVIGISETHLKEKPHEYYNLPGYKMEYVNRTRCKMGGVCIYVSDKVKYKVRRDLCCASSDYESCFIEIERNNAKNILAGIVYRAHTHIDNFTIEIENVFKKINSENKITYIMGDFNIDLLKDDSERPIHDYLDLIYSYSLIPTIYKPTRITKTSATLIDNILTNCENVEKSVILVTGMTDHMPTAMVSNLSLHNKDKRKNTCSYKRCYSDDNISKFKNNLSKVNWNEVLDNIDAEHDYNVFVNKFQELYDESIPLKKCTSKSKKTPKSPWITKGLLKSINHKNKLYKKYIHCPSDSNYHKFKTFRNKLHSLIRKAKRSYYFTHFEQVKNNLRQTWKTINTVIGRTRKQTLNDQFRRESGTIITDPRKISDEFNDFFVNVGPNLASKIHSSGKQYYDYLNNSHTNSVFFKPITEYEVLKIINNFDKNKSAGHDGIGNLIVKRVANEIAQPLTNIFNLSLSTGKVPDQLKIAKVIPIYKKDDEEIFSNYRPVSVLPCFSKILERLVFNRCIKFIDQNDILNNKQYGFRANHSTHMAIMQLVDKVNKAVEKNETTIGVYLDLSKAFDTIDHNILLYKLEHYGFRGVVFDWFKSYLNDRKQFVNYNTHKSDLKRILCGVPQGSILGPLLFILYINDIINTSTMLEFILFADDTTILYSNTDIPKQIQQINIELSEVNNWFKANKLSVNASKTNYMIMGTPKMTSLGHGNSQLNLNVILDDTELERVNKTKFLGVIIDENLTWKNHIDGITKTISRNIGMLNKLKFFMPERILYTLYCSLILPYINYGILIWGKACKTHLEKIHKLQKWAVRIISNSHYRSHSGPLFLKYNLLNVYKNYELEAGVFMYNYFKKLLPQSFNDFFTKPSEVHNYHTRNRNNYYHTRNKKVFSDKTIRTTGPILWNSLQDEIKNVNSTKHFRKIFKLSLLNSQM